MSDKRLVALLMFALTLICALTPPAHAADAQPTAPDPALEKRVTALAENLRCLVCQNQTIADSRAPLAIDLKNQVRDQLKQGVSEDKIVDYMVARYGDFVLYRPPMKATTLALWFGPAALLLLGIVALFRYLTRRRNEVADAPLSASEHEKAQALLGSSDKDAA